MTIPPAAGSVNSKQRGILPAGNKLSALLFCSVTFFFWVSLYLFVPTLPVYASSMSSALSSVGLVVASYAIPQILFRIPLGMWFDAMNRRKLLVAGGLLMSAIGAIGLVFSTSIGTLFIARAVTGIGAAAWVVFTVYFTGYYNDSDSARAIGVINFVNGIAVVTATACSGIIVDAVGFEWGFWGAAICAALSLSLLLATREPPVRQRKAVSIHDAMHIMTDRNLLLVSALAILLHYVNFAGIFGFTPLYAAGIGATATQVGILTMLAVGAQSLASLFASRLVERTGRSYSIVLASLILTVSIGAVPFITSVEVLAIAQLGQGIGKGIALTTLMSMSIGKVAPQYRATAMGVFQALYSIGMLLGPLTSGYIADGFGLPSIFYVSAVLSVIMALAGFLPCLRK